MYPLASCIHSSNIYEALPLCQVLFQELVIKEWREQIKVPVLLMPKFWWKDNRKISKIIKYILYYIWCWKVRGGSSKEKDKGAGIFYRVFMETSWRKWHVSNGLKERRKPAKRISRRRTLQAECRINAKAQPEQRLWKRRPQNTEGGLGVGSGVHDGENGSKSQQEIKVGGVLLQTR